MRAAVTLMAALLMALQLAQPAAANPRFAAIAVDARTGEVIFARNADAQRYPASLTKIMTLYLVFEDMKAGKITPDTRFKVSATAASRPPSKLGLRPGQTIRAEDAVKTLVTKSANDIAAVVAEALAGSESAFAERMTRKARALGMTRTTFRNASGLPDPGQVTTARDMATLGLRIQRDFPEQYRHFSLRSFKYNGHSYRNHNGLLGKVSGMDGIKTGYIRASGFQLVACVERGGKRIVAVVMGGRTAASRNRYMANLIEDMFRTAKLTTSGGIAMVAGDPPGYNKALALLEDVPVPRSKPDLVDKADEAEFALAMAGEGSGEDAETTPNPVAETEVAASKLAATIATISADKGPIEAAAAPGLAQPTTVGKADPLTSLVEAKAVEPATAEDAEAEDAEAKIAEAKIAEVKAPAGEWTIQVGAFPSKEGAESRLAAAKATGINLLKGTEGFTMPTNRTSGSRLYRARFSGLDEKAARSACAALVKKGIECLALAPSS